MDYTIARIGILDAAFTLRTGAGPLKVALKLAAENVNARAGELFPIDLALEIGEGSFGLAGRLGLDPPAYEERVRWEDLPLRPLTLAARPEIAPWFCSCRAAGDLEVVARIATAPGTEAPPGVELAGRLAVADLSLADPTAEEVTLGWKELKIVVREAFVPLAGSGEPPGATRMAPLGGWRRLLPWGLDGTFSFSGHTLPRSAIFSRASPPRRPGRASSARAGWAAPAPA